MRGKLMILRGNSRSSDGDHCAVGTDHMGELASFYSPDSEHFVSLLPNGEEILRIPGGEFERKLTVKVLCFN